jgi:histidinol-phosphate aminotransferase
MLHTFANPDVRHNEAAALQHHGDAELEPGLVDLAVNVRHAPMPPWLAEPIAASLRDLARYPDQADALRAVADRHARAVDEVLLTAGAAQAFALLSALRPRRAVVVHPQFTEPERALRCAGHDIERVILTGPFRLDPDAVPVDADLVVLGNPTNPTSVAHPASIVASLARPGRVLVVDEAFADTVIPSQSLAHRRDLPGLVVIRSLTKTWGLAGLRVGYLLAEPALVSHLRAPQPLWPVSTPALAAAIACSAPLAVAEERRIATALAADRVHLVAGLRSLPGVSVAGEPASSFVLVRTPAQVWSDMRARGFALRRGDTFPGLGPEWLRIAVRDVHTSDAVVAALADVLSQRGLSQRGLGQPGRSGTEGSR